MVSKIRELCKQNKTSIAALERQLGFGNGVIGRWDKSVPNYDRLCAVADALSVTVAELTDTPETKKDTTLSGDVSELPKDIQDLISICKANPALASALLAVAQQIETRPSAQE